MIRVGLIGLGVMGRGHLGVYERLAREGSDVKLVAVCDIVPSKLEGRDIVTGNMDTGDSCNTEPYARYLDYNEMFQKEQLDYVEAVIRVGASSVEFVAKLEDMTDAAQKVISYIGEAFGLRPDDDVTVKVHTNLADNIVVAEGGSVTFDWPGTEPRDGLALCTDVSLD